MEQKTKWRGQLPLFRPFFKGSTHFFVLALLFALFNTLLNSLLPQIIKITVDSVIGGGPLSLPAWLSSLLPLHLLESDPGRALLLCAGAVPLTALVSWLCGYLFRVDLARGAENVIKSLRDRLFAHIQQLPFAWHVRHQTGEIIQRCTSDVDVIRNFITSHLIEVFRIVFLIALSMWFMFSMNVKISLVSLTFIPVVATYSIIFFGKVAKKFRQVDESEGVLSSAVQENLTGVRVVRAFGREEYEIARFDERNESFAQTTVRLGHLMGYYWGLGDLVTGLQILTVAAVGVAEAVAGMITLGEFLAFISYNASLIWPVRALGRILSEMSKASVSIDRVCYILESREETDPPDALEPPMNRDIRFEHVSFGYGGEAAGIGPVLRDVSFTIPAGSTFAILGDTGSGKSTLIHLLARLYDLEPDGGSITVGGVELSQISRPWVRRNVGVVLQEPFLFSRTIRENISAFRPGASFEEVRGMAGIACVDEAILDFGDGYDTMIGERGVTLSGGQKQRVAIARMLMQQAPVMVFDDSLSAVDAETDAKIRAALNSSLGHSTVILISHRVTTLMQAQTILVLDDGRVAELGTHEELLQRGGIYKSIYDIQMNSADRALLEQEGD